MADSYSVTRRTTIAAPPSKIFARINDLHRWVDWSPWEGLDPELQRTFSGSEAGVGARYAWSGNRKAGAGEMEIIEATEPSRVAVDVRFEKPMKSTSISSFDIVGADGDGHSEVTWTMTGRHSLFSRVAAPLGFFDKLIGKDFEKGLAQLKSVSEKA
ncbi:SRPBCC family protein [Gordonia sp. NPDC003950]